MANGQRARLMVDVGDELMNGVVQIANSALVSRSDVVRWAIRDYVAKNLPHCSDISTVEIASAEREPVAA